MIFILIGIIIILYAIKDYKKALIIFLAYKLFLVTNITIISIPGIPILSLEDFMNIFFVCLYFTKIKLLKKSKLTIPYQVPFVLMFISITLSMIFSVAKITSEFSSWIKYILNNFLIIDIIWNCIESKEDFKAIYKLITFVMLFSCIYAIYEYTIQKNPLTLYEQTLNHDTSKVISFMYNTSDIRGYRVNSIFEHAIGAGINWGCYVAFTFYYFNNKKEKLPFQKLALITMLLCLICIFLTKMRAGILFTSIALLGSFNFRKAKTYVFILSGIMVIVFTSIYIDSSGIIQKLIQSFFNGDSLQGSSISMRLEQLKTAFSLLSISPIVGLGQKYSSVISKTLTAGIIKSESIWFVVIPCFGIIGIIVWINYFIYLLIKIPRFFKNRPIFFFSLAYFITYTMTSLPGIKNEILFLCLFYFIKESNKYKNLELNNRKSELDLFHLKYQKIF